ncbi:MAG: alpha/beta hydrolase [Rudaea sp.]
MAASNSPIAQRSSPQVSPRADRSRSRTLRRGVYLAAGLALPAALVYLGIGAYIAHRMTAPPAAVATSSPAVYSLAFESPQIRSRDGIVLASWFIPRAGSDRAVLMVHGLWTCRGCEFYGRFVELASRLHDRGYNVLMIDLRKHGESGGDHFTFGAKERWDVLAAVDWLDKRGLKVGVLGVSLGAVSAAGAVADPEGGANIRALVLDSPYADSGETLAKSFSRETGLPTQLLPGAFLMGRLLLGADLGAIRPPEELRKVKTPLLLIYGAKDRYISREQMEETRAARPDAQFWLVDDAGHAASYMGHDEEYTDRAGRLLDAALQ